MDSSEQNNKKRKRLKQMIYGLLENRDKHKTTTVKGKRKSGK